MKMVTSQKSGVWGFVVGNPAGQISDPQGRRAADQCTQAVHAAGRVDGLPYTANGSLLATTKGSADAPRRSLHCLHLTQDTVRAANTGGISGAILWTPVRDGRWL